MLDDCIYKEEVDIEELEETQCPFIKRRKVRWIKRQTKGQVDIYMYKLLNLMQFRMRLSLTGLKTMKTLRLSLMLLIVFKR